MTFLRRRAFARNVDFSFIVSGSERTFTFRASLNTLPTLAMLVRDSLLALPKITKSSGSRGMDWFVVSVIREINAQGRR